jgi:hypothetical protein
MLVNYWKKRNGNCYQNKDNLLLKTLLPTARAARMTKGQRRPEGYNQAYPDENNLVGSSWLADRRRVRCKLPLKMEKIAMSINDNLNKLFPIFCSICGTAILRPEHICPNRLCRHDITGPEEWTILHYKQGSIETDTISNRRDGLYENGYI